MDKVQTRLSFLSHAIASGCFKDKGTSRNQNTRFQQEIAAQYKKTNGNDSDAEHQMSIMDENEETMLNGAARYEATLGHYSATSTCATALADRHPKHPVYDDQKYSVFLGCSDTPIREWSPGSLFISMEHIIRGTLPLGPISGAPVEVFYVMDCADEDMFLRVTAVSQFGVNTDFIYGTQ
ncbi:hypothetical protein B0H13DRAFT_1879194 [Mycena leptocephala]|nr:hypothetical protein B0H13DRAFT_1879194 [Mycena leptocephala]